MSIQMSLFIIGILLIILSIMPLFYHIHHAGVTLPLIGGIFMVCLYLFDKPLSHIGWWVIVQRLSNTLILIGLGVFFVLSLCQFFGFKHYKGDYQGQTVIVLGCKVRGDRPTKMLAHRLDKAALILTENPSACCVVSGGQGADEDYPEAQIMANYLIAKGVCAERIFQESSSCNTLQNIQFSATILTKHHLSNKVIIVTDFYHQYRSNFYAKRLHLIPTGASGFTNPALVFSYWVRESFAVIRAYLISFR